MTDSPRSYERMAVAIPAYCRADLLATLLAGLPLDRISAVYISIDGARGREADEVAATVLAAQRFAAKVTVPVHIAALSQNVGAAINVLGAVTWMLQHEERGAVLEDDCHPIPEFFDFIAAALDEYESRDDIWLACGTQFAPADLIDGNHLLSRYPLIWGWGTSRAKWMQVRAALVSSLRPPFRERCSWLWQWNATTRYWAAGHRRARAGFVDAWDLPLVHVMRQRGVLSALPQHALVSNVGDDARATHTADEQRWTRLQTTPFAGPLVAATSASARAVDQWLERELYGISVRHLVSPAVSWLRDHTTRTASRAPLAARLPLLDILWRDAT